MLRILIIAAAMPAFFRRSRRNRDLLIHHRAPPEVGHSQNMSYLQDLIQQTGSDVSMNTQIRTGPNSRSHYGYGRHHHYYHHQY